MKKVAFITVHVGPNFGSNLQSIATSNILKKIGHDSILVNYIPQRVTYRYYVKKMLSSIKSFLKGVLLFPKFCINTKIYNTFLCKYCNVSAPIYSNQDFTKICPQADIYLTGSDQVWNSTHNQGLDTHYYFEGIKGKKVAYASSFGVSSLPNDEYEKVKSFLKDYTAISVREKSAVHLLQTMGYEATHVLDPTLMLDKQDWTLYMSKRLVKEPYILMYLPYNIVDKDVIYKTARKIAAKHNLKVVTFSWNYFTDRYADKTMKFCNPGDFLSLMHYAEYVITNSFHGTAFSINLNKQFWVYMPSGFGTRIQSILDLSKLTDRLLVSEISEQQMQEKIDFNSVNLILSRERNVAVDFLKKSLS